MTTTLNHLPTKRLCHHGLSLGATALAWGGLSVLLVSALIASPVWSEMPDPNMIPSAQPTTPAARPVSRLNALLQKAPQLYMPESLKLGAVNKFFLRGTPGKKARLYLSNSGSGEETPNGLTLRVGKDYQTLEGVIPEKGVLEWSVDMPGDEELAGNIVFIEAILWGQEDFSDAEQVEMVDSSGRRTGLNQISIIKPAETKGPMVLPTMPGMPDTMIRNLTNMSDAMDADGRKRELLDNGRRDTNNYLDQNTFIQRTGGSNRVGGP